MQCPKKLFHLVSVYFLRGRLCKTEITFLEQGYNGDCPQGSFFWNLIANTLLELDLGEFVKIIVYADDFGLRVFLAPNAYQCSRRKNVALEKNAQWAVEQRLDYSGYKVFAVYFRKPRRLGRRRGHSTFSPHALS